MRHRILKVPRICEVAAAAAAVAKSSTARLRVATQSPKRLVTMVLCRSKVFQQLGQYKLGVQGRSWAHSAHNQTLEQRAREMHSALTLVLLAVKAAGWQ